MGTWMEFRCEARTDAEAVGDGFKDRCWSHDNSGPMQESHDSQAAVASTYKDLARQAARDGWKKTKAGWVCPFCAILPGNTTPSAVSQEQGE